MLLCELLYSFYPFAQRFLLLSQSNNPLRRRWTIRFSSMR
jgi:hypothetical protein